MMRTNHVKIFFLKNYLICYRVFLFVVKRNIQSTRVTTEVIAQKNQSYKSSTSVLLLIILFIMMT
jgi:hypothetical protein